MLSPAELELILTVVDDEATPDQLDSARELLAASADATRLYREMSAQRDLISQCQVPIPESLVPRVLDRLPTTRPNSPSLVGQRDWIPYLSALCLFVMVAVGAFWFTWTESDTPSRRLNSSVVRHAPEPLLGQLDNDLQDPLLVTLGPSDQTELAPKPQQSSASVVSQSHSPSSDVELAPFPSIPSSNVVASAPLTDIVPLTNVELRLPWLVDISEFQRPENSAKLRQELARSSAFRIDIHTKDVGKAIERLQSAGQGVKIKLTIELLTQDRLLRKQLSSVAIYIDSLTSVEIAAWLEACFRPSVNPSDQAALFQVLHLIPATSHDAADVRTLLGIDPGFLKRPSANAPITPKPISSGTLDEVTNSLRGTAVLEHQAIALAHTPSSLRVSPSQSKLIRTFLETRGERRSNSISVLLILR